MKNSYSRIPEAPESNAGDDFHVLWTIRKSIQLLNFDDNGLKAITVEGIDLKTSIKIDPYQNQLLGVDIAEYYGGEDFSTANKVIVSQLKYSTRRANENWTFSSLYAGTKKGGAKGSVFHRFGQIFNSFYSNYSREEVVEKLKIRFISNREFSALQLEAIEECQAILKSNKGKSYFNTIVKKVPKWRDALTKIKESTNLSSTAFCDFLRILDFEECGTNSREYQDMKNILALQKAGIQNQKHDSLFRMVWKKMLPEAIDSAQNIITVEDLLACLTLTLDNIFPAKNLFERNDTAIPRNQLSEIIQTIYQGNSFTPICIHGSAGYGKSTIIQQIKERFKRDSYIQLYDCYGAGTYLNPSDSRHKHQVAIPQICNTLAKDIGSSFLFRTQGDTYLYIRDLKERISEALSIIRQKNLESLLVLIIDAADNSISAGKKSQSDSFIKDILNETFPEGFRLVLSTRSSRIDTLNLPEKHTKIKLEPFDLSETKRNLLNHFPGCSESEIKEFHELSNGIPRVQGYSISLRNSGLNEVIEYLKPNGKTVDDLIYSQIVECSKKIGYSSELIISEFFSALIELPRPIPIAYIASVTNTDVNFVKDFTIDLWHGLVLDSHNQTISFRDEDFEEYIRVKYSASNALKERIAEQFLLKAASEDYASENLAIALFHANKDKRLIEVVVDNKLSRLPVDPLRNKRVLIQRATLALKMSKESNDVKSLFKLIFICAEFAKTDDSINRLIIENSELVASFGETDVLELVHDKGNEFWYGPIYYRLAAVYSRDSRFRETAIRYYETGSKWINWRLRQTDEENQRHYNISHKDIAYGAESILRLYGPEKTLEWLKGWRPKDFVFNSSIFLIDNLLINESKSNIRKWLSKIRVPLSIRLIILECTFHYSDSFYDFNREAEIINRFLSRNNKVHIKLLSLFISFCEKYLRIENGDKDIIYQILEKIDIQLPDYLPTLYDESKDDQILIDSYLRRNCLIANLKDKPVEIKDLYPSKFLEKGKNQDYKKQQYIDEEKRKFDRFFKHAISIYGVVTKAVLGNRSESIIGEIKEACASMKSDWEFRYYDRAWGQYKLLFLGKRLLKAFPFVSLVESDVQEIIDSFTDEKRNYIKLRLIYARRLSLFDSHQKTVLVLLSQVDGHISNSSLTSSERVDFYIESSEILYNIDLLASNHYFNKAIKAISEIDIEAYEQIKCISGLSKLGVSNDNKKIAFEFSRFIEFCHSRLRGYDHFPMNPGIQGIGNIDISTAFAVLCRWDQRGVIKFTEYILSVLHLSIDSDYLSPKLTTSLLPLNIYYWKTYVSFIESVLPKYDSPGLSNQKDDLLIQVLRDVEINASVTEKEETIHQIFSRIEKSGYIGSETLNRYQSFGEFVGQFNKGKHLEKNTKTNDKKLKNQEFDLSDIPELDYTNILSLNTAMTQIQKTGNVHDISKFLREIRKSCSPDQFIAHLNALIECDSSILDIYRFKEAIKERLSEWDFYPLLSDWKKDNFKRVLIIWFDTFLWDDQILFDHIDDLADYFSGDQVELVETIVEILLDRIDKLPQTSIYQSISFIKGKLNHTENSEINEPPRRKQRGIKTMLIVYHYEELYNLL